MWTGVKQFFLRLFRRRPPLELSYSKISTYRFCPWKYKLMYAEGMRVPPNPYISLGLSIHRTLEVFHRDRRAHWDDLLEIYNEVWVNEGFQNPQQAMQFFEKGEKMLRQYMDWCRLRKSEVVAVEREFQIRVGPRVLRGIIDRIDRLPDNTYEVIDYKTHAEMWDQSKIDSDLQLTLYALGCAELVGQEPASLSYFFLAHNRFITTQRSQVQKDAALAELEAVAQGIEKGDFAPNTAQCARCDFRAACRHSAARKSQEKNGT